MKTDTCRICFKQSTPTNKHKWMDLDIFVPIIQSLAKTKIFSHSNSPKKVCGSCANGLIMANLFRMKVIESNAICRDLCNKLEQGKEVLQKVTEPIKCEEVPIEEQIEIEVVSEEPMYEEYLDETFLEPETVPKEEKFVILNTNVKYAPFAKRQKLHHTTRCCLCDKHADYGVYPSLGVTEIFKSIRFEGKTLNGEFCTECKQMVKHATSHFQRIEKPVVVTFNNRRVDTPCQFCLKRCREVCRASVEIVETFLQLPQPEPLRNVMVGGRCCPICVKNLEALSNLIKVLNEKEAKSVKVVVKLEKQSSFDDYLSIDDTLDDYQCHMSDIEDAESDTSMPEILFGQPLNTPPTQTLFKCSDCKLTSHYLPKLEAHIEINHNTASNICNICHQLFKSVKFCKRHKSTAHFGDSYHGCYKQLCEYCGLCTRYLDAHITTHTNTKPYECDLCPHRSRTKVRITEHIFAMHTNTRRYKCSYCDKGFSYYPDKARHEISKHTKLYKHVCEICNKCFVKKNLLKAHQDTHDGVFVKNIE